MPHVDVRVLRARGVTLHLSDLQFQTFTVVHVLLHPCNSRSFLSAPRASFFYCRRRGVLRQRRPHPSFGSTEEPLPAFLRSSCLPGFRRKRNYASWRKKRAAVPQNALQSPKAHLRTSQSQQKKQSHPHHKPQAHLTQRQSHTPTRTSHSPWSTFVRTTLALSGAFTSAGCVCLELPSRRK